MEDPEIEKGTQLVSLGDEENQRGRGSFSDFYYNDRNDLNEVQRFTDTAGTTLVSKSLYAYDDGGRVTSITHKNAANATVDSFSYQYDSDNRLTQETSTLGPTRNPTYDKTDQLTATGAESFAWDANGNPTGGSYSTGTGNRVSTDGAWNFYYNAEGNLTSKVKISTTETYSFTYDHNNQLTKVEHKATSGGAVDLRVTYQYDVFGQRVVKSVDADGDGAGLAVVTKFSYEAGNIWADLDNSGSLTTRRIYGFGLDSLIARIGSSSNEDWYLTDKLGSVRDIVNSSGTLIDHIDYTAFGVRTQTSSSNGDRYGFTGREHDDEWSAINYRARYTLDGRWMSEDPMGFAAGDANLRRYVGNGPTNATDPSGLWPDDVLSPSLQQVGESFRARRQFRERSQQAIARIGAPDATNFRRIFYASLSDDVAAYLRADARLNVWNVHHSVQQGGGDVLARRLTEIGINVHDPIHLYAVPDYMHWEINARQGEWWQSFVRDEQVVNRRTGRVINRVGAELFENMTEAQLQRYRNFSRELTAHYRDILIPAGGTAHDINRLRSSVGLAAWRPGQPGRVASVGSQAATRAWSLGRGQRLRALGQRLQSAGMSVARSVPFVLVGITGATALANIANPSEEAERALNQFMNSYQAALAWGGPIGVGTALDNDLGRDLDLYLGAIGLDDMTRGIARAAALRAICEN